MDSLDLSSELKKTCIRHFQENLERIIQCVKSLNKEQVWFKYNDSSNSVGNLVLHLNGNIGQYVLSSLGKAADKRNRFEEFKQENKVLKHDLIKQHRTVVESAMEIMQDLSEAELLRKRSVQGFELNGLEILIHVTEHYSYHVGQVAQVTKQFLNKDLAFYKDLDLNALNENG